MNKHEKIWKKKKRKKKNNARIENVNQKSTNMQTKKTNKKVLSYERWRFPKTWPMDIGLVITYHESSNVKYHDL